jgi:predicted GTPase
MIPVSASHGRNMTELLETICDKIGDNDNMRNDDKILKIIFVGKPNVENHLSSTL